MVNSAVQEIDQQIKNREAERDHAKAAAARLPFIEADLAALKRVRELIAGNHNNVLTPQESLRSVMADVNIHATAASYNELIETVLRKAGKPMSAKEIVQAVGDLGKPITRDAAIGGVYRNIKNGKKRFKLFGPGRFGLYEWPDVDPFE